MKKLLLIPIMLLSFLGHGQKFQYEVIKSDSLTKDENYKNSVEWASQTNKETRVKKIKTQDSNLGMVSMELNIDLDKDLALTYNLLFNLRIDVKDNKYKVSFLNPTIVVGVPYMDYSIYNATVLNILKKQMSAAKNLSANHFGGKMEWDLKEIEKVLASSINADEQSLLNTIIDRTNKVQNDMLNSIYKTMEVKSDW